MGYLSCEVYYSFNAAKDVKGVLFRCLVFKLFYSVSFDFSAPVVIRTLLVAVIRNGVKHGIQQETKFIYFTVGEELSMLPGV